MKLHIIRLAIGFTALVASFLPQKADAFCFATCDLGWCMGFGKDRCWCDDNGKPKCEAP